MNTSTKAKQPLGPKQRAWVNALRDGGYKQEKYNLQSADRFCCLGVACKSLEGEVEVHYDGTILEGDSLATQEPVMKALGLRTPDGSPDVSECPRLRELRKYIAYKSGIPLDVMYPKPCLTDLNDRYELDFDRIAYVLVRFADLYFEKPQ